MDTTRLAKELKSMHSDNDLSYKVGTRASWSPKKRQVLYKANSKEDADIWGLLHEVGHALLNHDYYISDIELIKKEVEAWEKADVIAKEFKIVISESYKQNCLETYRNWLYKRSSCPNCYVHGIQKNENEYYCLNCFTHWYVSSSKLCRPYRVYTKHISNNTKNQGKNPWLFVTENT